MLQALNAAMDARFAEPNEAETENVTAVTSADAGRFVDANHIRHWANGGETSIDNLVLLCRHHHRLVHEGGFGVDRAANGQIRFSRPNGLTIEEHPRLPPTGSVEGLLGPAHRRGNRETGEVIDASCRFVPGDTLDYDIAIEGLMQKRARESCRRQTAVA